VLRNRLRSEFIWQGKKVLPLGVKLYLQKLSVHLADISVALRNECLTIKLSQFIVSNSKARFFFQPNMKKFKICASIGFIFRQPVIVLLLLTSNFPVLNSVIYLVRPNGDFFPRKSDAANVFKM